MATFGINGFGRIGRLSARVWWASHQAGMTLGAINTSGSMELQGWAHLLRHDTAYGPFSGNIACETYQKVQEATDEDPLLGYLILDSQAKIAVLAQRDPAKIPWQKYGVEVVIESTGVFTTHAQARAHLAGGAKRVVLSAPPKGGEIPTSVISVHEDDDSPIISNASCTTNCVAPIARILEDRLGILKAAMTTIHSYTDDQNLQDASHKDLRRARAAGHNIVPTTTGAAISATEVVPELKGLFDGVSLRVPTLTGSLTDFTFLVKRPTTVAEINGFFTQATLSDHYAGILSVTDEPLVSSDIRGRSESAIVDLALTQVIDHDLVKIFAWYDNEWGYANRLVETVQNLFKY